MKSIQYLRRACVLGNFPSSKDFPFLSTLIDTIPRLQGGPRGLARYYPGFFFHPVRGNLARKISGMWDGQAGIRPVLFSGPATRVQPPHQSPARRLPRHAAYHAASVYDVPTRPESSCPPLLNRLI